MTFDSYSNERRRCLQIAIYKRQDAGQMQKVWSSEAGCEQWNALRWWWIKILYINFMGLKVIKFLTATTDVQMNETYYYSWVQWWRQSVWLERVGHKTYEMWHALTTFLHSQLHPRKFESSLSSDNSTHTTRSNSISNSGPTPDFISSCYIRRTFNVQQTESLW